MRHQRSLLVIAAVASATLWAYACGDGTTEPPPYFPGPATITVSPATTELTALGATVQLSAEVRDQNGAVMAGATVTWASSDAAAATVNASGLVTAVANGSATITATAGGASGSATVTVAQAVSTVAVTPVEAGIAALGDTVRLAAEALDANGNAVAGSEFSWESGDAAVATVDASGLVMAVANGNATITATSGSVSGNATVTVAQEASTVTVTPAAASIAVLGDTVRLTAEALDANGNAVSGAEFSWESSDGAVATVDASGLVTAVASGSATITATSGSASGSASVNVARQISAVTVTPDTASVVEGDTLRLAATATDADGQVVTGVAFAWASGDTAVAVVDASGLVTGIGAGRAQVTATAAGVTGRATLTVVVPSPTTVTVTPDTVLLTMVGQTAQLTAEVRDQAGRVMEGIAVAWSSADTTVAVVDSAGLVTAVGGGAATVTARAGEASGDAIVSVMQSVDSVTVSPPADTIAPGDTLRLVAEAYDESGHMVVGASFTWSSSNAAVATVDPSGLVRGAGEGTATITATAGDVSGTSEITVVNPGRAALVALYNATDGPNWINNTNWLTDAPLGEWYGVDTDASGRVVRLDLAGRWDSETRVYIPHGLRGELPIELANLTELTTLSLAANSLSGPIPTKLGNLTSLKRLELYHNRLSGPIPPQLGELAELRVLYLNNNSITGRIPPELGSLAELTLLMLRGNQLSGPIPQSFLQLDQLRRLYVGGQDVCVPGASAFVAWFVGIGEHDREAGIFCNAADVAALKSLYRGTGGAYWNESGGWSGDDPVEEWHGVTADSLGHVTELALEGNGLTGRLPSTLGDMLRMTVLRIADNALSGRLPRSLTALPLVEFRYSETELCVPAEASFQDWLNAIASLKGTGVNCAPAASDGDFLEIFYNATRGSNWARNDNWLTDAPLRDWYGVEVNSEGRVSALVLTYNNLSGRVPPEVGNLAKLERLNFDSYDVLGRADNNLTGPIPPELGNLARPDGPETSDRNNLIGQIPHRNWAT